VTTFAQIGTNLSKLHIAKWSRRRRPHAATLKQKARPRGRALLSGL